MVRGQAAKNLFRLAGNELGDFLGTALNVGGRIGKTATQGALNLGAEKLAPGMAQSQIPKLFRSSSRSVLPQAGEIAGKAFTFGTLMQGAGLLDQQSDHSQPMPQSTGLSEADRFLMQQQLAEQKFRHEMALTYAREEARIPGTQMQQDLARGGMSPVSLTDQAKAEQLITEAGEAINKEVIGVGRMLYGTGLRAY
tara:strand:- start:552 stop:1139 length:588 start_codon:yes stop_codon:yes gene_type:complete